MILCNCNQEQRLLVTSNPLIIFPLIIARSVGFRPYAPCIYKNLLPTLGKANPHTRRTIAPARGRHDTARRSQYTQPVKIKKAQKGVRRFYVTPNRNNRLKLSYTPCYLLFSQTINTAISAGDTPDMRDACPKLSGFILSSFCRASSLSAAMPP